MHLPRRARKWLDLDVELEDVHGAPITAAAIEATFDAGLTWVAADTAGAGYRWLLEGPDFDPRESGMPAVPVGVEPVQIIATSPYAVRAIAAPEVLIATGTVYVI